MVSRSEILRILTRARLLEIAYSFDIAGLTGLPKGKIAETLARRRSIPTEEILSVLSRNELKAICHELNLDDTAREKTVLIRRILKGEKQRGRTKAVPSERIAEGTIMPQRKKGTKPVSKEAETYRHPESDSPLRPDVGTQAQFPKKKRKPPKQYKYDSSLSPALDWDGQNATRELGEWLIGVIEEASRLEPPHIFQQPREFKSADGRVIETITGLHDAIARLKALSKPFLNWAGKAERLSFEVPTLPMFVHERLSTKAIVETLTSHRRDRGVTQMSLLDLFGDPQHSVADQVLKAYEYRDNWVNRMILGDSLVVMNSLLHYENLGGQVQMIYMDPPYGVEFHSNFQPFVRRREVKDQEDVDAVLKHD